MQHNKGLSSPLLHGSVDQHVYLQYDEVGYLIMLLLSGHESMVQKMVSIFRVLIKNQSRLILRIMEMISGKSWRPKTCTTKTPFTRNVKFRAE